jgi:hypothetical protein
VWPCHINRLFLEIEFNYIYIELKNVNMEKTLSEIQSHLESLPYFSEQDCKNVMGTIKFISSGARDKYDAREALTKELVKWSRNFIEALNSIIPSIKSYRSNYSAFEVSIPLAGQTLEAPYVLDTGMKSSKDFKVRIINFNDRDNEGKPALHYFKKPMEVINYIRENS